MYILLKINQKVSKVETVQDFLIKLGIKPLMHLLENSEIQSHFSVSKIGWIFPKKNSVKNTWLGDQLTLQMFTGNYGGHAGKICDIYGKGL